MGNVYNGIDDVQDNGEFFKFIGSLIFGVDDQYI